MITSKTNTLKEILLLTKHFDVFSLKCIAIINSPPRVLKYQKIVLNFLSTSMSAIGDVARKKNIRAQLLGEVLSTAIINEFHCN